MPHNTQEEAGHATHFDGFAASSELRPDESSSSSNPTSQTTPNSIEENTRDSDRTRDVSRAPIWNRTQALISDESENRNGLRYLGRATQRNYSLPFNAQTTRVGDQDYVTSMRSIPSVPATRPFPYLTTGSIEDGTNLNENTTRNIRPTRPPMPRRSSSLCYLSIMRGLTNERRFPPNNREASNSHTDSSLRAPFWGDSEIQDSATAASSQDADQVSHDVSQIDPSHQTYRSRDHRETLSHSSPTRSRSYQGSNGIAATPNATTGVNVPRTSTLDNYPRPDFQGSRFEYSAGRPSIRHRSVDEILSAEPISEDQTHISDYALRLARRTHRVRFEYMDQMDIDQRAVRATSETTTPAEENTALNSQAPPATTSTLEYPFLLLPAFYAVSNEEMSRARAAIELIEGPNHLEDWQVRDIVRRNRILRRYRLTRELENHDLGMENIVRGEKHSNSSHHGMAQQTPQQDEVSRRNLQRQEAVIRQLGALRVRMSLRARQLAQLRQSGPQSLPAIERTSLEALEEMEINLMQQLETLRRNLLLHHRSDPRIEVDESEQSLEPEEGEIAADGARRIQVPSLEVHLREGLVSTRSTADTTVTPAGTHSTDSQQESLLTPSARHPARNSPPPLSIPARNPKRRGRSPTPRPLGEASSQNEAPPHIEPTGTVNDTPSISIESESEERLPYRNRFYESDEESLFRYDRNPAPPNTRNNSPGELSVSSSSDTLLESPRTDRSRSPIERVSMGGVNYGDRDYEFHDC